MTSILAAQIVARSVFQEGFVWTDELARYLMIALVFFGASVATRDRSHITVSIFEDWKPSLRKWFSPVQWVVMLTYAGVLLKFGLDAIDIVGPQLSPNMRLSMGIVYATLPVSAVVTIVHLIARINKAQPEEEGGENKW